MRFRLVFLLFSLFYEEIKSFPDGETNVTNNEKRYQRPRVDAKSIVTLDRFAIWPKAVVPFYIEREHFDADQATYIMTTLSLLAYKTCIKFVPVLTRPGPKQHVMVFHNPGGIKKCDVDNSGHSIDDPHYVNLGYECLQSPQIEMKLLQALGLSFEHNRPMRDIYIDVQPENIESGYLELFTKDEDLLPKELQALPYDMNSVLHFGERQFSRNGHRTIIIKDINVKQDRKTFTDTDLQKINIIYGKSCLVRDRKAKVEMCQKYPIKHPNNDRRKRFADYEINGRKISQDTNLRVNQAITPKREKTILEELGIETEVNTTVHAMYKFLSLAFRNAIRIFCNSSAPVNTDVNKDSLDVFNIKEAMTNLSAQMVNHIKNGGDLCTNPELTDAYLKFKLLAGTPKKDKKLDALENTRSKGNSVTKYADSDLETMTRRSYDKYVTKADMSIEKDSNESDGIRNKKRKVLKTKKNKDFKSVEDKKTDTARHDDDSDETEVWTPVIVNLTKENQLFYGDRKWPNGVVRYIIEDQDQYDTEDLRTRLAEVNSILKSKTCVRLEELRSEEEGKRHRDYLLLDTSPDYVTGRVGGRQQFGSVELFKGGQHRQHTAMMVMAMLGFYFEVARHDRDKHIRVHFRHIRPNKLHHFEKIREEATFQLPYDYESAAHPAWQFWRKTDKTGISSVATYKNLDPDGKIMKSLGQHPHLLSELDIVKINSVYGVECFKDKIKRSRLDRD